MLVLLSFIFSFLFLLLEQEKKKKKGYYRATSFPPASIPPLVKHLDSSFRSAVSGFPGSIFSSLLRGGCSKRPQKYLDVYDCFNVCGLHGQ